MEKEIPVLSKQISDIQASIESMSNVAFLGVILACFALIFILIMFFVVRNQLNSMRKGVQIKDSIREYLAIGIVVVGICIVGLLGIVALVLGDEHFRREALAGILPLIGAWVGAVIAYYFGKENFQAASDSTAKLLNRDERLAATPVEKVMLSIGKLKGIIRTESLDEIKQKKIKKIADAMNFHRAPVLSNMGLPLLIIHKSTLQEYLADNAEHHEHKLENMISSAPELWNKINAFGTIKPGATAAEVKLVMQTAGKDCSDVYVTEDGTNSSPVIGLVTNVDLLKADHL